MNSDASHYSIKDQVPAREILSSMRHISPHVIFEDAPISYMAEGQAQTFYQGEGEDTTGKTNDPSVIIYYIVRPTEY